MSNRTASSAATAGDRLPPPAGNGELPPRRRRRWPVVVTVLALVAAGIAIAIDRPFGPAASTNNSIDNGSPTSLATVTERSLSSQVQVDATLGYAGSYTAVTQATGTLTWLPAVGATVREGAALYGSMGRRSSFCTAPCPPTAPSSRARPGPMSGS